MSHTDLHDEPTLGPAAEEALVRHRGRFLAYLTRRVGDAAMAEELLQSALVRALEKGVPADDEEGTVNWFHRVLKNAVVDHYRSRGAETRAVDREAGLTKDDALDPELRGTICACMRDVLPAMKPEYADIVRKVDLDERTVTEAAREAGITPNNAAVRLHRARQALRRGLERMCGACAEHGCLDCSCHGSKAELGYERR